VLKPMSDTVTEYAPPGSDGIVKLPSELVTALYSSPVPLFLILTSAPGSTPPDESTTVPDNDVKKLPCAYVGVAIAARTAARTAVNKSRRAPCVMNHSSWCCKSGIG